LLAERDITDDNITLMTEERKQMETRVSHQCKVLAEKKKSIEKKSKRKKKIYQYQLKSKTFLQQHTMGVS
jgi:hypothetical protein